MFVFRSHLFWGNKIMDFLSADKKKSRKNFPEAIQAPPQTACAARRRRQEAPPATPCTRLLFAAFPRTLQQSFPAHGTDSADGQQCLSLFIGSRHTVYQRVVRRPLRTCPEWAAYTHGAGGERARKALRTRPPKVPACNRSTNARLSTGSDGRTARKALPNDKKSHKTFIFAAKRAAARIKGYICHRVSFKSQVT